MAHNKARGSILFVDLDDESFSHKKLLIGETRDKDCGGHTPTRHGGYMIKTIIRCH